MNVDVELIVLEHPAFDAYHPSAREEYHGDHEGQVSDIRSKERRETETRHALAC